MIAPIDAPDGGETPHQALRAATAALADAGVSGPQADARRLLLHVLQVSSLALARPRMSRAQSTHYGAAIAARLERRPVSQIIGLRHFWRHQFRVTRDTLDPRPETETLVARALDLPWARVLDLGTGTGAILLSLLAERPGTYGLGADLSPAALDVARSNAERLGIRAEFALSDWFDNIAPAARRFDLIVSNPPYIATDEMPDLAPELRLWEPRMALTDDGDGLGAYRRIARDAPAHLSTGGGLLVEIGATQGSAVAALFQAVGFQEIAIRRDADGRDRVVEGHWANASS